MFGKLFGRKPSPAAEPPRPTVVARLNARVQPIDRGALFEDPLDDALQKEALGMVSGGGTQLAADPDGIAWCAVDLDLKEADEAALARVIALLEGLGAPKGSALVLGDGRPDRPFGQMEGLGLFLNGTDLAPEVYAGNDINALIDDLHVAMGQEWHYMGFWQGKSGTALFFYGPSFARMAEGMAGVIADAPLCQRARVAQIA